MFQLTALKTYLFYFLAIILLLMKYSPYSVSSFFSYFPLVEVCFIFYFYVYRQNHIAYLLIFLITIVFDSMSNNLIGSSAIVAFLTLYLFKFQKKLFWYDSFREIWVGFVIFLFEFNVVKSLISFLLNHQALDIKNTIYVNIITILIYPILHNIFYYLSLLLEKSHDTQ